MIAKKKPDTLDNVTPIATAAPNMIIAWIVVRVMPPRLLPNIMENRLTGATRTSLRKPNSLSQRIEAPVIVAENSKVMPTIPGARKLRKPMSSTSTDLIGKPRKTRIRKGIASEPIILAFTLINLFISRSHMV